MKLKYYLRGLGIGIFVTALILIIANHAGNSISDEEIIKRAEDLGMSMTEEATLFAEKTEEDTTQETTASEEDTVEEGTTEDVTTEVTTEEVTTEVVTTEAQTEAITEAITEVPTTAPVAETTAASGDSTSYTLVISRGMYSEAVSTALQSAGIISSASDFNTYLVNTGYAERLQTGTYSLNSSMTYEQIAAVISR